jgi:hypothetical protein
MDQTNYARCRKRDQMKNASAIQEWVKLSGQTQANIFGETANAIGLSAAAIEKDWWVVRALEFVFASSIASHTVFKGGTSLSKAWNVVDRFSEILIWHWTNEKVDTSMT